MPRLAYCLLLLLPARPGCGQQLFRVREFSPDYYARVWLARPAEVFSAGWVAVYERKTGRQLLKVSADELFAERTGGQVKAGVHELPYGEQSVVQYADFNFDGVKDFAIEDGHHGCYHGPSFRVFLAQGGRFVLSEGFTALAQEYCGLFGVDRARQRLTTMTKDGCCWHQYNEYVVRRNEPELVQQVEEEARNLPFVQTTTTRWSGPRKTVRVATRLDVASLDGPPLWSFRLAGTGRRVLLLGHDEQLRYVLLNAAGAVELAYPDALADGDAAASARFTFRQAGTTRTLTFRNGSATYQLYEKPAGMGIVVTTPGKNVDLPGLPATATGSLARLAARRLPNLGR